MKFITEYDLRVRFNEQPFTDYCLKKDARLTPGARQFLSDRRIKLLEDGTEISGSSGTGQTFRIPGEKIQTSEGTSGDPADGSRAIRELSCMIEILEAEFLVVTSCAVEENIGIAERISETGREFGKIRSLLTENNGDPGICFRECSGMKTEACCRDMGNCFELSDLSIRSANGKTLVRLNVLRARIRMICMEAAEVFGGPGEETRLKAVTGALNRIINKISQIMCEAAEVKECRRIQ